MFRRFFFILNLATLPVSHNAANLYRQICVTRSAVGNEEMSALKYGIIYWAKIYQTNENESNWALAIDRLIASRHLNARSFGNPAGLSVLLLLNGGSRPRKAVQ